MQDVNGQITLHFKRRELQCHCGCGLCNPTEEFKQLIEHVRQILGVPMYCEKHSGCRCRKHNAAVGGSPNSKHMSGQALDFDCGNRLSPVAIYNILLAKYIHGELSELGGMGLYKSFVHIDCYHAEDGHLRLWRG